ncbi:signal peptide-containing protein [Theileria equi strain WA]|uniref:Signal peptide-containing protein n=1 Tax=Theileria equi strain WA TaxID=1537102 RepID=L0AWL2_THEEQ|nr:signal peptide-containing protein [Theileria equi strain WA]AFZ79977.1 signal peptide-containing protein [Theileria equi strain WA]|eukprot:XP_004829643.1 signal peptide-containing protein [Theileria equi strain WA]
MKTFALFYLVFLSRLCSCTGSDEFTLDNFVYRIIDARIFRVTKGSHGYVPVFVCMPKKGVAAKVVTFAGEVVWKSQDAVCLAALVYFDGMVPVLTILDIEGRDKRETLFLYRDHFRWVRDRLAFRRKLDRLSRKARAIHLRNKIALEIERKVAAYRMARLREEAERRGEVVYEECECQRRKRLDMAAGHSDGIHSTGMGTPRSMRSLYFPLPKAASVNIAEPSRFFCRFFDYYYDDVQTRLVIPDYGVSIKRLTTSKGVIWSGEGNERLIYAAIHLRNKAPALAQISLEYYDDSLLRRTTFAASRTPNGWEHTGDFNAEFARLRVNVDSFFPSVVDLSIGSTSQCEVFETILDGIPTMFHYPKHGFHAKMVRYGPIYLWGWEPSRTARGPRDQRVIMARTYLRNGMCFLVKLAIRDSNEVGRSINYVLEYGRFVALDDREAEVARQALKAFVRVAY